MSCCRPQRGHPTLAIGFVLLLAGCIPHYDDFTGRTAETVNRDSTGAQSFVRPVEEPLLSDFCRDLTSFNQEDVDEAETFPEVLREFLAGRAPARSHGAPGGPATWSSCEPTALGTTSSGLRVSNGI